MNAGKTTLLLQSAYNYKERGMDTLLFLPKFDNRSGVGTIGSRIGLKAPAIPFAENFNFFEFIAEAIEENPNIRCSLIDEAQFLKKQQVAQLKQVTIELNRPVLTYGLRSNFMGELFEGSKYLFAWAEELNELKTVCHCGRKATMVLRLDENKNVVRTGKEIQIGGNDQYVAVCYEHFIKGDIGRTN
jgi:thymidine kinase